MKYSLSRVFSDSPSDCLVRSGLVTMVTTMLTLFQPVNQSGPLNSSPKAKEVFLALELLFKRPD